MKNHKLIAGFLFLLLVEGAAFSLWRYTQAAGNMITVCIKKDGLVHVIGEGFKRADCKTNESILSWNVEGPQGPKGGQDEQGQKEDKGDTGSRGSQDKEDQGRAGKNGTQPHLFDGKNQDLGILIDSSSIYVPSLDKLVSYVIRPADQYFGILVPGNDELLYEDAACAGPSFIEIRDTHQSNANPLYVENTILSDPNSAAQRTFQSHFADGVCGAKTQTLNSLLTVGSSLPFNAGQGGSLTWPPHIREVGS